MKVVLAIAPAVWAFVLLASGCSKKDLDREMATGLIQQSSAFQSPHSVIVDQDAGMKNCSVKLFEDRQWRALRGLGWINPQEKADYKLGFGGNPGIRCDANLTVEGQKHTASWVSDTQTYKVWHVPVAARKLLGVTGVAKSGQDAAIAQFQYGWELTDFGALIFQSPPQQAEQAAFRRYDDGWRLESFGFGKLPPPALSYRDEAEINAELLKKAWAPLESALRNRATLSADLVKVVESHPIQKGTLEAVGTARSALLAAQSGQPQIQANCELDDALGVLAAESESQPKLRSDPGFLRLQDQITGAENEIAKTRRAYNEAAQLQNSMGPAVPWPYVKCAPKKPVVPKVKF